MRRRRSSAHTAALLALAAIAIFSATAVSGCAWLGKGMEVSDAYKKANEAKTGGYITSLDITAPKRGRQKRVEEFYSSSGVWDGTDANHPKSHGEVTVNGDSVSWVEPGNGRVYFTEDGKTDYFKITKGDRPEGRDNGDSILDAVARSVVNFRDAPQVTNAVGQPIPAIAADISREKLCGVSLRAAARTINSSSLNDDSLDVHISRRAMREGTRWCSHQLPTAPQLTFGIDNGLLTDYMLNGTVKAGKRTITVAWRLQLYGLNQPQTGFIPPKVSSKSKGATIGASAARAGDRINEMLDSIPEF